ncbi:hypothetical protein DPMN_018204 [Dreissena polymorpha]|uniref:Uncharacterized protein n=1 Tax=Dreissena polymorpha TaxID=45954 RepID=A0A9D4S8X2_DREPO|nr:hypothetical protein DPMN_018204 [Dreissena polymorpha]
MKDVGAYIIKKSYRNSTEYRKDHRGYTLNPEGDNARTTRMRQYDDDSATIRLRKGENVIARMRERESTMTTIRQCDDDSATIRQRQCDSTIAIMREYDYENATIP